MSSIPVFHFQIKTDDRILIGSILQDEGFLFEENSSKFVKKTFEHHVEIDLGENFRSPSIVCCVSNVSISLRRLLSEIELKTSTTIPILLLVNRTESIDWNSLINFLRFKHFSSNFLENQNDFSVKLVEMIEKVVKEKKWEKIDYDNKQSARSSRTNIQVNKIEPFFVLRKIKDQQQNLFEQNLIDFD